MLLFGILTIETFVIILQVFKKKIYKSSMAILIWFAINSFYSPAIYYTLLNGSSYKKFSDYDYKIYLIIGICYLLIIIMLNLIFFNIKIPIVKIRIEKNNFKNLAKVVSAIIVFSSSIYILVYRNNFPLLHQLLYGKLMKGTERPDVSGTIPFYFTVSTIICTFLPMRYFYFKERLDNSVTYDICNIMLIAFFLVVGGNKGLLVYFAIFVWLYIWKMKIDWRIAVAAIFLICLYEVTNYGNVGILGEELLIGLVSPIRRFFVTQGAMFINRIALINSAYDFNGEYISGVVYRSVYMGTGGSAPTYFIGDLIVQFGYIVGFIISSIFTLFIYMISRMIDKIKVNKLYILWTFYYLIYLIGNASISLSFFIRLIIVSFLTFILSLDTEVAKKFQVKLGRLKI